MKTCESLDSAELGNAEVKHHIRYHSEPFSSAVPVLFVLKKPKPNPDSYEGSLRLSVSTKSYELSRGKRKFTEKNLPRKMHVTSVPSVGTCRAGFFEQLFQFSAGGKKKGISVPSLTSVLICLIMYFKEGEIVAVF